MIHRPHWTAPLRRGSRSAIAVYGPALAVLLGVALAEQFGGVYVGRMTRDPNELGGIPFYYGVLSNLGVLLWCAAAAVCLFAATLLRKVDAPAAAFFACGGGLTAILLLDDLFLVHDVILPTYFGLHEVVAMAVYGVMTLLFLGAFAGRIRARPCIFLLASLAAFALSLAVDREPVKQLLGVSHRTEFFLEDGAKFLGIASWLGYFATTAYHALHHTTLAAAASPLPATGAAVRPDAMPPPSSPRKPSPSRLDLAETY